MIKVNAPRHPAADLGADQQADVLTLGLRKLAQRTRTLQGISFAAYYVNSLSLPGKRDKASHQRYC